MGKCKSIALILAWWFILRVFSTGVTYSTLGPFPTEKECRATAARMTVFCGHGILYPGIGADGKPAPTEFGACQSSEVDTVEKDCYEVL